MNEPIINRFNNLGAAFNQIAQKGKYDLNELANLARRNPERAKKGQTRKNQDAMKKLFEIVGTRNHKQDIKRINEAQSINGAKNWINKKGMKGYYTVEAKDIDNDGIKDVLVKDINGQLVIVNGYTVKPSQYPLRSMYYELPPEERKDKPFKQWYTDDFYTSFHDGEGMVAYRDQEQANKANKFTTIAERKGFNIPKPKDLSPYQLFAKTYISSIYDYAIKKLNLYTEEGKKPNIFTQLLSYGWNHWVLKPVLYIIFNQDKDAAEEILKPENSKQLNNLKKQKVFKDLVRSIIADYFSHSDNTNGEMLNDLVEVCINLSNQWFEKTGAIKREDYGLENPDVSFNSIVESSPVKRKEAPINPEDVALTDDLLDEAEI